MPTNKELEQENEALRIELDAAREEAAALRAELSAAADAGPGGTKVFKAEPPSFGMSEGERTDLVLRGVTNSPWTGERLNALDAGVEPGSGDARKAAERERDRAADPAPVAEPGRDRVQEDSAHTFDPAV